MQMKSEEIKIELDSPTFEGLVKTFNSHLINVLAELKAGNFEEADINLKLNVALYDKSKELIDENEIGSEKKHSVFYKSPVFEHEVKSTFKRSNKDKGTYSAEIALEINEDGEFVAVPVKSAQMTMDEFQRQDASLYRDGQKVLNEMAEMAQKN